MRNAPVLLVVIAIASPVYADDPKPAGSARQRAASNTESGSFTYARLGYGGVFAGPIRRAPAIGFGYRGELDHFAVDVSFLNYVIHSDPYSSRDNVYAGSFLRLQALRFLNKDADRSAYVGAGLSWGGVSNWPRLVGHHIQQRLARIRSAGRVHYRLRVVTGRQQPAAAVRSGGLRVPVLQSEGRVDYVRELASHVSPDHCRGALHPFGRSVIRDWLAARSSEPVTVHPSRFSLLSSGSAFGSEFGSSEFKVRGYGETRP